MLKSLVENFILFTREEVELWRENSLKFYLILKNESNEVKGNYLREKSKSLIASIRLRFEDNFTEFTKATFN